MYVTAVDSLLVTFYIKTYINVCIASGGGRIQIISLKVHCNFFYRSVNKQRHRALGKRNTSLEELVEEVFDVL